MAQRWKGIINPATTGSLGRGSLSRKFRVFASLVCASSGSLLVPASNAIFFVGDRVTGSGNPVVERLSQLENIAAAVLPKLGQAVNLWIMEPSHYMGPFACYENLLPSLTSYGDPVGYDPQGLPAARGCLAILHDCLAQVKATQAGIKDRDPKTTEAQDLENCKDDQRHFERGPSPFEPFLDPVHTVPSTILLGFSKGGVVLNQILAEMVHCQPSEKEHKDDGSGDGDGNGSHVLRHYGGRNTEKVEDEKLPPSATARLLPSTVEEFLNGIEVVHYVDVGLNCRGAYQTDPKVLSGLAKFAARFRKGGDGGLSIGMHGTPRQWQDPNRQWIYMEKNRCLGLLKEAAQKHGDGKKLRLSERLYFPSDAPSMQMHFQIIDALVLN